MPIKFVREKDQQKTRSYTPPTLFGSPPPGDLKRRIFLIYIGLGAIVLALALTNARRQREPFQGQPILRGVALVTEKNQNLLILDLNGLTAPFQPEPEILNRLDPGDRITILYQRSPDNQQIKILEIATAPIRP